MTFHLSRAKQDLRHTGLEQAVAGSINAARLL